MSKLNDAKRLYLVSLALCLTLQLCEAKLFPTNLPERQWQQFTAEGFSQPATGVIYRNGGEDNHGVPVGGIGTGYLNIDLDGTIGEWTLFNNLVNPYSGVKKIWLPNPVGVPRNVNLPFLGLSAGGNTTVLTLQDIAGVQKANQIDYWGHYPVADLEYGLDGPIGVGVRVWAPFLPGDTYHSNTPGVVFEVHLRNESQTTQSGCLAISMPGMDFYEAYQRTSFARHPVTGAFNGVHVSAGDNGYALGVIGSEAYRSGGSLGTDGIAWASMNSDLLAAGDTEAGTSIAVDFTLPAGQEKTVRFVLGWYAPFWPATPYTNMYRYNYCSAAEVADYVAVNHAALLQKVLAWQGAIYTKNSLPDYLREGLVNSLHSITKGSSYVCDSPSGQGLLSIMEAAGYINLQDTSVVAWWGDIPVTYFFPELRLSTLRKFASFQDAAGRVPFVLGTENNSLDSPALQVQEAMNAIVYTHMIDRLIRRFGNPQSLINEFYPVVKKAIQFEMTLCIHNDGLVSKDPGDPRGQTFDSWPMYGQPIYIQTLWLSALQMAKEMALNYGDSTFAQQCDSYMTLGLSSLEQNLWNPSVDSYLLYKDPSTGQQSDTILSFQLDGSFVSALSGLPEVFPSNRVSSVLNTIKQYCVDPISVGAANAMKSDGTVDLTGGSDSRGIWPAENSILAALYAYKGDSSTARSILGEMQTNMVLTRQLTWNFPQGFATQDGQVANVGDYYWGMALWAVPPALLGQDVGQFCASTNFVDDIIQAAGGTVTSDIKDCSPCSCGQYATNPHPDNGQTSVPVDSTLSWSGGCGGVYQHKVIFSDDINVATEPNAVPVAIVPSGQLSYNPGVLEIGKKYYWRIDEIGGHTGSIWSFTTLKRAYSPTPADKAIGVGCPLQLRWQAGPGGPYTFNVYFGLRKSLDLADCVSQGQSSTAYVPDALNSKTIYYWRVDAVDSQSNVYPGDVWSFTTAALTKVKIGDSSLIGILDFSDSFTTGLANGRNNTSTYNNYAASNPDALKIENHYGNSPVSWSWNSPRAEGGFAFRTTNRAKTLQINAMADTGCLEMGGGLGIYGTDPYIPYGIRNDFIVQMDAVLAGDRIDISVGNGDGLSGNCLSVFFRTLGVGLYRPSVGETNTGIPTNIINLDEWHNYAVYFNRSQSMLEIFIDEESVGMLNLAAFAGGAYQSYANDTVSIGIGSADSSNIDNFQVGSFQPCPNRPRGDLTRDCKVNLEDLQIMVSEWLDEIDGGGGENVGLIGTLDYSDTFTVGLNGRNNSTEFKSYTGNALNIENSYENPVVSWATTGDVPYYFRDTNRAKTTDTNPMADSGIMQSGPGYGSFTADIIYGLRDKFVVQFDLIPCDDRMDVRLGGLSLFIRHVGHPSPQVGVYAGGKGETDSGLDLGFATITNWHNAAFVADVTAQTIDCYSDEVYVGTIDLKTMNAGSHNGFLDSSIVGIGSGSSSQVGSLDNFRIGSPEVIIEPSISDLDGNLKIDYRDFVILASEWLTCNLLPQDLCNI